MWFENVCSIADADPYTKFEGKNCQGYTIQSGFTTLRAAKAACSKNNYCRCIEDSDCYGYNWKITKGDALYSSSKGSCAWIKGKR